LSVHTLAELLTKLLAYALDAANADADDADADESSWRFEYGGVDQNQFSVPLDGSYTSSLSELPQQFALRLGKFSFLLDVELQPANGFFFRGRTTGHQLPPCFKSMS
jgi:hypothetical protein